MAISVKTKFTLITVVAILLAIASGIQLKQNFDDLSQLHQIGYGFILIASLMTASRGFRYLMSLRGQ
jgi:hypothetical protein